MAYSFSMRQSNIGDFVSAVIWCERTLAQDSWALVGSRFWFINREDHMMFGLIWMAGSTG